MPTQDQIFEQICTLVEQGASPTACGPEFRAALRARYFAWIVKPGKKKNGDPSPSPQEVWEQHEGSGLRKKFEKIGEKAGKKAKDKNKTVQAEETDTSSLEVEGESDCDWCRPPGG
jgi:hypothetical protein